LRRDRRLVVTAYRVDPKTGALMLGLTPAELEIIFILALRGLDPETLNNPETKKVIKGLELVYENYGPRKK